MEIIARLKNQRMSRFQIVAVTIAVALMVVDGMDVAILAYAAPDLSREWQVSPELLGFLLSSSLIGMAISSMALTPLSDKIGRRPYTLISLVVVCVGLVGSVFSPNVEVLIASRLLTGLGVGGMTANLSVLISEYSSDRRRSSILGIFAAGYAIGSTIGGLLAGQLVPAYGWRSIFVAATVLTLLLLVVAIFYLPESVAFLIERRPKNALTRVNAIISRMNYEPIESLPPVDSKDNSKSAVADVLTPPVLFRTLAVCLGYGMVAGAYYFGNTWIPQIITISSGSEETGILMGTLVAAGGIVGSLLFSALALKFRTSPTIIVLLLSAATAYALFSGLYMMMPLALLIGAAMGLLATGANAGFFALGPSLFETRSRATGVGFMFGVGRTISFLSPILVGFLIGAGVEPTSIFLIFSGALIVAAASVGFILRSQRHEKLQSHKAPVQPLVTSSVSETIE